MAPKKGSGDGSAPSKTGKSGSSKAAGSDKKKISVADIVIGEEKPKAKKAEGKKAAEPTKDRILSSSGIAVTAKGRVTKAANNYLSDVDLPPSDDEEDPREGEDETGKAKGSGIVLPNMDMLHMTDRQAKKKEKKEEEKAMALDAAKKEALKEDDDSAFSVVLGSKMAHEDSASAEASAADHAKDVKVDNFSVSVRGKELFKNASVTIVHGRRYGLVGPNGKGKSTVMKLLAMRKLPVPRGIDVLLVEQEIVADDRTALQAVVSADVELVTLREEEVRLRNLLEKYGNEQEAAERAAEGTAHQANGKEEQGVVGGVGEAEDVVQAEEEEEEEESDVQTKKATRKVKKAGRRGGKGSKAAEEEKSEMPVETVLDETEASEKLTQVYERMREIGAEAAESRASKILAGLGFSTDMQARATRSFSGGWRMRISLARALFIQPTLLLLDEPTNHLDLRAVLWLEEYLMRWKKTLVVVSHDRDFLNSVCTDIIHLHDMKLFFYRGNFESFEEMYEKKRRENNKQYEVYEKQLKAAKQSGSKANQDKVKHLAKRREERQTSKKAGKGGKGGGADADEDTPKEAPTRWRDYSVEFHFPEPTELNPPLLQLRDVAFSYPNRADFGLNDIDVAVDMGTRVAIVGPNGAGKSTLLNLLAGDLQPTAGESRKSQKLRMGRYSQHFVDLLTMDETPVEYLLRLFPSQEGPSRQEAVRSKLGKFGLPSFNHLTPIVKLSGGQKARVVFTAISMAQPHILLLDEPTNHLDMQSIDALADALDEFTGGVVLVSHDSRLISRVCDDEEVSEIWVVEDGTCKKFPGSFEDYKNQLLKEIIAEVEE